MDQNNLSADLRDFVDRTTSNGKKGVQATLCVVVNTDSHTNSFGAGNPDILAHALIMTIDKLNKTVPDFAEAWLNALRAKRMQAMISHVVGVVQEAKGMEAAKPAVDALIEKLKGNPGAVPGPDTKQ